jgi:uncharacterized protein
LSPGRRRALVASLALLVALLALASPRIVAVLLSTPIRTVSGQPPADLGATSVHLPAPAGPMSGWLARGVRGGGAVLLLHGVHDDRRAMLGRARALHAAGYTVLLVDAPAHGESAGDRITFGARESAGARAAIAYLRAVAPGERVGALGVSMGGASLLLGGDEPPANQADAVVLEMVYPTIEEAVTDRLRLHLGPLGPRLAPMLLAQLSPRLGIGPAELRPVDRIRMLRVPLLSIVGAEDRHTTLPESERLFAAAPGPKSLWVVPKAKHEDLHALVRTEYERHMLEFFGRYLRPAS